jgi:hypothetical protein
MPSLFAGEKEPADGDDGSGGGVEPLACDGPFDAHPVMARAQTATTMLSLTMVKFPSRSGANAVVRS